MGIVLLSGRMLLSAVFGVAALAKLADRTGWRDALRDFGVPAPMVNPLGILLPLAELAVAVTLMYTALAWWSAAAALMLLLIFITAIAYNLAKGRKPKCRCFGQLHSTPVGWPTLLRNVALGAVAGLVVGAGRGHTGPSIVNWIGELSQIQRIEVLLTAIVLALLGLEALGLVQVLKQQGRMLRRLEILEAQFTRGGSIRGLPVGAPAPAFALPNLDGEVITLDALRARGLPVVLVFTDPECGACRGLAERIAEWQREHAGKMTLAMISRGTAADNRAKAGSDVLEYFLLQRNHEVDDAYDVDGTPTGVLVRADGTIGSPQAGNSEMIESLVVGIVGELGPSPLLAAAQARGNGHAAAVIPS